jgi:flagellar biosynthesis/type III secretory pathway chaperone
MAVKPITPIEAANNRINTIPDEILQATNELITQNYRNGTSIVKQDDIVWRALQINKEKDGNMTRNEIFDNGYLDIEEVYGKEWQVIYDKPAYCEDYPATFKFKRRVKTDI